LLIVALNGFKLLHERGIAGQRLQLVQALELGEPARADRTRDQPR
jgi:hypothetical protein